MNPIVLSFLTSLNIFRFRLKFLHVLQKKFADRILSTGRFVLQSSSSNADGEIIETYEMGRQERDTLELTVGSLDSKTKLRLTYLCSMS